MILVSTSKDDGLGENAMMPDHHGCKQRCVPKNVIRTGHWQGARRITKSSGTAPLVVSKMFKDHQKSQKWIKMGYDYPIDQISSCFKNGLWPLTKSQSSNPYSISISTSVQTPACSPTFGSGGILNHLRQCITRAEVTSISDPDSRFPTEAKRCRTLPNILSKKNWVNAELLTQQSEAIPAWAATDGSWRSSLKGGPPNSIWQQQNLPVLKPDNGKSSFLMGNGGKLIALKNPDHPTNQGFRIASLGY